MKNILIVFGTRPEVIKLATVIDLCKKDNLLNTVVCNTGQHKELVDDALKQFNIYCDYNCNVMKQSQELSDLTNRLMSSLIPIIRHEHPDLVIVHGDTTTAFVAALLSSYMGVKIAHIEAGLRTWNIMNPFPEEMNRRFIDMVSTYLYAPTKMAKDNLIKEGFDERNIIVTGNTAIDILKKNLKDNFSYQFLKEVTNKKIIICTLHRRELTINKLKEILKIIKKVAKETEDSTVFVFSVHPEPNRARIIYEYLNNIKNIILTAPLRSDIFQNLLNISYAVVTDSGGIQEEASYLGKPLLLVRNDTERPECVGVNMQIIGINGESLYIRLMELLTDSEKHRKFSVSTDVYGTGDAASIIYEHIKNFI